MQFFYLTDMVHSAHSGSTAHHPPCQDIMSNPGNIGKYQNDPDVMNLMQKAAGMDAATERISDPGPRMDAAGMYVYDNNNKNNDNNDYYYIHSICNVYIHI